MEFGVQGVHAFNCADDVALHHMPHCHAKFARRGHGFLVASTAHRHGEAPLLQRVVDLEKFLGRLHEQGAGGSATMAFERGRTFILAALLHNGIQTKIGRQFACSDEALDITNGGDQAIQRNEIGLSMDGDKLKSH
jgi:hypothetical protein